MRTVDYRLDVLRNGVRFGHILFDAKEPPAVYCDADSAVKCSFRGSVIPRADVDLLTDELQPVCIVDGAARPLGIYRTMSRRLTVSATGRRWEIEAYDRSVVLQQSRIETRAAWPAGTGYDDIILHYLQQAGISRVLLVPSGHSLQTAREDWEIGTSLLDIINALLAEINYRDLWFDLSGIAHVEPYVATSASNVAHHYGGHGREAKLLLPEIAVDFDIFDRPNVFIAVLSNPEMEPETATAVNDFPQSALSVLRRGMRIPQVTKVSNIAPGELQAYADRLRDAGMRTGETVTVASPVYPDHGIADVVALELPEQHGVYRETSWTITMQAGSAMQHSLERLVIA